MLSLHYARPTLAPMGERARLIEVGRRPVAAWQARADVEQVRPSAHRAHQMRMVIGVIRRHRGTAPAAFVVGGLIGAARLLAVAIEATLFDIEDRKSTRLNSSH